MSTANWLTLIGTIAALAVMWGELRVRVRLAERLLDQVQRGREKQGERLGVVEERLAMLEGAARPRRRTQQNQIEQTEDE